MGSQELRQTRDEGDRRAFVQGLLRDLRALERMIDEGRVERGVDRIGAEQELVLVDRAFQPTCLAEQVLTELNDSHFTTELGQFNIEFNLDPHPFAGDCLSILESELWSYFNRARHAAHLHGAEALLTGISPTLEKSDLTLRHLTDRPRYWALNEALQILRDGRPYELTLKGVDELRVTHDNMMLEACNTSFQVHFQVDPESFAKKYNATQAVTGIILAAACNSPVLFGRQLWHETRIALFQQSIETRNARDDLREFPPRVSFGSRWVKSSVTEIYKEDIARFKSLFSIDPDEDPAKVLDRSETPELSCLKLHNGTVYRWNRPCYGVANGSAHLRIENRVLPAGPTPADEVANAALWFGLIRGVSDTFGDIADVMEFDDAASNFWNAAQHGLDAQLWWPKIGHAPARELIPLAIIPLARNGLQAAGIDSDDIERYLGIIEARVCSGQTGSRWAIDSLAAMRKRGTRSERMSALVASSIAGQASGNPIHEWPLATFDTLGDRSFAQLKTIDKVMTTDLFTVNQSDVIDLAISLMEWQHVRYIPVEDDDQKLVGLLTHRLLLKHLAARSSSSDTEAVPVSDVMITDVVSVQPSESTLSCVKMMTEQSLGCLPIVNSDGVLVGLVTEHDFYEIASPLFIASLESADRTAAARMQGAAIEFPPPGRVTAHVMQSPDEPN